MRLTGQQTLELKLNQVSQKQKQFRQGMWIKRKNNLSDALWQQKVNQTT